MFVTLRPIQGERLDHQEGLRDNWVRPHNGLFQSYICKCHPSLRGGICRFLGVVDLMYHR